MKKDYVLGLISSYPLYFVKPFFYSLTRTGFTGTTVIFVNNIEENTFHFFDQLGIKYINYTNHWPYINDPKLIQHIPSCDIELSPNSLRYLLYYAYLKTINASEVGMIMLTDVRDVYFQKNPFEFPYQKGLSVFLEDSGTTIGTQFHNKYWIVQAFGENVIKQLEDKAISCSGVTVGDFTGISEYLRSMIQIITTKPNIPGLDQGIHNYLLHFGKIPNTNVFKDDEGPVSTISYFKPKIAVRVKNGLVKGLQGQTINIVHQYDRHNLLLLKWNFRYFIRHKVNQFKGYIYKLINRS